MSDVEPVEVVEDVPVEVESAPTTVFVRGSGGGILEMDVPTEPSALERFDASVAKGDLLVLDSSTVEKVDVSGGGYVWAEIPRDDAPVAPPADVEVEAVDEDDDSVDSDGDGTTDKAELLAEAEKLGVTVDKRWGIARIAAAIEAANS